MSDSDSDTDSEWEQFSYTRSMHDEVGTLSFSGAHVLAEWNSIPVKTRREASQRFKVCVFWLPIILQPDNSSTNDWALDIGLINSKDDELTLVNIIKIQIVESFLYDLEKVALEEDVPKLLFYVSQMSMRFFPDTMKKAMKVLEKSKDPFIRRHLTILGAPNSVLTLSFIFSEYAKFIQEMCNNTEKTLMDLMAKQDELSLGQSESLKKMGNEYFQKQLYEQAVKYYSKAIQFHPDNHILYGNRALCYIKIKEYLKAAVDGKCAVLIQPLWAKGHYRYCEALFHLNQNFLALEANKTARSLCRDDPEGLKDLEQQHQRLQLDHSTPSSKPAETPESSSTASDEQTGELCSQPSTPPVCSAGRASTPDPAASASRAQPGMRFRKRTRNTSYADYILAMHEESREDRLHRDRLMDRHVEMLDRHVEMLADEGQKDREQEASIRQQEMANRKADTGSMRLIARQHKRIADSFAKLVDVMAARK